MFPNQLGDSVRVIVRKPIYESLQVAGKIDDGGDISRTEKSLSDRRGRLELHQFLEPGGSTVEEFVRQQAGKDATHSTSVDFRPP